VVGTGHDAQTEPAAIVARHRWGAPAPMALRASVVREIGERLDLSRHTVKTQAMSIYRKLGVSSRSQAIQRLQEISLVGHRANPRPATCPFMPSG
jgi:hypothetical protein